MHWPLASRRSKSVRSLHRIQAFQRGSIRSRNPSRPCAASLLPRRRKNGSCRRGSQSTQIRAAHDGRCGRFGPINERLGQIERAASELKSSAAQQNAKPVDDAALRRVVAASLLDTSVHQSEPYVAELPSRRQTARKQRQSVEATRCLCNDGRAECSCAQSRAACSVAEAYTRSGGRSCGGHRFHGSSAVRRGQAGSHRAHGRCRRRQQ